MRHLYASSQPLKTTVTFVKHATARSVVFGFFRHDHPKIPDCRLAGVVVNIRLKVGGKTIILRTVGDFINWVRQAGVWGYCKHVRRERKEVHYWLGKRATRENAFEFVMHEVSHAGGFRGERTAIRIAGLGGFALTAYDDYFREIVERNGRREPLGGKGHEIDRQVDLLRKG